MPPDYVAPYDLLPGHGRRLEHQRRIFLVYGGTVSLLAHPTPYRTIFKPGDGLWTLDELSEMVPTVMGGVPNPAPPPEDLEIPGRPQAQAGAAS
jgi:hypothetical protein